jgi:hypothetical protein
MCFVMLIRMDLRIKNYLSDAPAVAKVNEYDTAMISAP